MGLIATRLAERSEVRNSADWINDDDAGIGRMTPAGVRVTREAALSVSTFWRCVDLISHAVSLAPTDVVVKVGGQSFPEYSRPRWLATPNPDDPNYTAADYFGEQTLAALVEGNFFTSVLPDVYADDVVLVAEDPRRVNVKPGPLYEILDAAGKVIRSVGPNQMLHGWWMRLPGMLRGISPLEALRRGIGSAIAAEDYGARFFGQGASLSFGVEVPGELTPTQKDDLTASLKRKHQGLSNSHAIGVLTRGAKFVPGLAPTPEQAQMLATRQFSVEDIARIFGVPAGMAGSQQPGASSYASAIEWRKQFRDDAVLKFTDKLERSHARLLFLPTRLLATSAEIELKFNLDWIARTDLLARYQAHAEGVRGGFLTPNEARGYEDKARVEGGDRLYMQSQMVPLDSIATAPAVPSQEA